MRSLQRFRELIGGERAVTGVCQALHFLVSGMQPKAVGAMHVTCADECEDECAHAFRSGFVSSFLPSLKLGSRAAFRLANLGGIYEWGAVRIAEQHFAVTADGQPKLLVIKINSHVAVGTSPDGQPTFGTMQRYRAESPCCGALAALLRSSPEPFADRLAHALRSEGKDRLAILHDRTDEPTRALRAALASVRLQARQAVLDIQDYEPVSPTGYLVIPCVTVNRLDEPDTEIVCGIYSAEDRRHVEYFGLGDDPADYRLQTENRRLRVTDASLGESRPARDHRELVMHRWRELRRPEIRDDRLEQIRADVQANRHRQPGRAKILLSALIKAMAEIAPVTSALMAFANGAVGIHNAFAAHRLATELAGDDDALRILAEVRSRIDGLAPRQAEALLEQLLRDRMK